MAKKKVTGFTITPTTLDILKEYANHRGISRSSAVEELILYAIDQSLCASNPQQIEQAVSHLRLAQHRLA